MKGHSPLRTPPAADDLVAAVTAEAADGPGQWFPGFEPRRARGRVVAADVRARCFLYRIELDDGDLTRQVIAKVRHSQPALRRLDRYTERPVLNPERTMSDHATARREYDGLELISAALAGNAGERFGVLRSLAWLPAHSAIVMDCVQHPTLRRVVLETSRFRAGRRSRPMDETAWVNAGAWLRIFHDQPTHLELTARTQSRDDVVTMYRAYADFLTERLGSSTLLTDLAAQAGEVADATLPRALPLSTGHGDFVANNMFADPSGRVTVFDPLPCWRVPRYQDLATLVVGVRLLPVQATTQGLAVSAEALHRYEMATLRGYFGADPIPLAAARAYQLLVLLDKWSALVSKAIPHGSVRPQLHEARVRVATRHYRREARRLLSFLTKPEGADVLDAG